MHGLQKQVYKTWRDLKKDYCFSLWSSSENRGAVAVRVLTGTKRREHIPPVLTLPPLPPVHTRIDFKLRSLVHKALNDLAPQYMLDLLKSDEPPRPLRSSGTGHLDVPRVNSKCGGLSFHTPATKSLPDVLVCSDFF